MAVVLNASKPQTSSARNGGIRRSDLVYKQLLREIVEGKIPPGSQLREQEISDRFGISRTPLREALNRLAMEEFVESVPNSGVFVKSLTMEDIEDSYVLRASLEALAARLACERGFPDGRLIAMRKACQDFMGFEAKNDLEGAARTDIVFHQQIHGLAKSRMIQEAVTKSHIRIMSWQSVLKPGRQTDFSKDHAGAEHQAILAALERRDGKLAARLCEEHVMRACNRALTSLFSEEHSKIGASS